MRIASEEPFARVKSLLRKGLHKRRYRVHRTFQLYLQDCVTVSAESAQQAEKLVYRASTAQSVLESLRNDIRINVKADIDPVQETSNLCA